MVNRKKSKKSKKSTKRNKMKENFSSSFKYVLYWAIILFLLFILLMFFYNHFHPENIDVKNASEAKKEQNESSVSLDNNAFAYQNKEGNKLTLDLDKYSLSHRIPDTKIYHSEYDQIIMHKGYTISYNSDYKIANWVAYDLTPEKVNSKVAKRSDRFVADPKVKGRLATNKDYLHSGYDRGHLVPAADMKWSDKAMKESFYFSNITPQHPGFNRGIWKDLEDKGRFWAQYFDTLYVITGPVVKNELKRFGKNAVGVPKMYYKIFCSLSNKEITGIGFLIENKKYNDYSFKEMVLPIDSIEKITNIDFYSSLPESIQDELESKIDFDKWFF